MGLFRRRNKDLRTAINVITWMTMRLPDDVKQGKDWEDVDRAVRDLFTRL